MGKIHSRRKNAVKNNRIVHVLTAALLILIAGAAASLLLDKSPPVTLALEQPVTGRTFPTREGRREVFVKGEWRPVVTSTRSKLAELIPPGLTPGEVVHVNDDGTCLVTSHVDAARRQNSGGGPWPPSHVVESFTNP